MNSKTDMVKFNEENIIIYCKHFTFVYKQSGRSSQKWENHEISLGTPDGIVKPEVIWELHIHFVLT